MTPREHRTGLVWVMVTPRADSQRIAVWGIGYLTGGVCRRMRRADAEAIERAHPGVIEVLGGFEPPDSFVRSHGSIKIRLAPEAAKRFA